MLLVLWHHKSIKEAFIYGLLAIAGFLLSSLPWILYILHAFPIEAGWMLSQLVVPIGANIQEYHASSWYYIHKIRINFNELIYTPLIFLVVKSFRKLNFQRKLLLLWIFLPLILLSLSATKREVYMSLAATPIFIVHAWMMVYLYRCRNAFVPKWRYLANAFIVISLALAVRYSAERIKPLEDKWAKAKWRTEVEDWLIESNVNKDSIFIYNTPHSLESRFYYDIKAYPWLTHEEIEYLKSLDFQVFEKTEIGFQLR